MGFPLLHHKLGVCKKCMALAFVLAGISIAGLVFALGSDLNYFAPVSSVAAGAFGTLFCMHVLAYVLRRIRRAPPPQDAGGCCD
ncbi:MAG: DUF3624 family protein [Chloroflexi bacterium]|nr:DUF3624 family protein [Chloroflexota bacterium]